MQRVMWFSFITTSSTYQPIHPPPHHPQTLAELATQLPLGDLRDWCVASGRGIASANVYADSDMLSRCRAAANSSFTGESNNTIEESKKIEDVYRQQGGDLESLTDVSEDEENA